MLRPIARAVNLRVPDASVSVRRVTAMLGRSDQQASASGTRCQLLLALLVFFPALTPLIVPSAQAEVRVVNAQGEHWMGDRDTREDAVRLATEAAKRNALEQVATYLESVTVVDGMDVTKDEIHTYTAGLVLILDQQTNTALEDDAIVVKVDLVAQIDTEEVTQAIAALRENEDARVQLVALKQENEQLQQELDAANQALASASTPDQAQQAAQQRQEILNRVQSNAMVSQAWTDWVLVSPVVYPPAWIGVTHTQALLNVARGLYPASPHVTIAQEVITTRQPPVPPQPPAPESSLHTMPSHEIVPHPGGQGIPRTLNEIIHTTPTAPPQISNRPGHRTLTDVHQLNPLLPPSTDQPQQSRSMTRMQQFLQQNGGNRQPPGSIVRPSTPGSAPREAPSDGQPPAARRFSPRVNQMRPPMLQQQIPRGPSRLVPNNGGGRRGDGGGRGGGSRGSGSGTGQGARGGGSGGGGR